MPTLIPPSAYAGGLSRRCAFGFELGISAVSPYPFLCEPASVDRSQQCAYFPYTSLFLLNEVVKTALFLLLTIAIHLLALVIALACSMM